MNPSTDQTSPSVQKQPAYGMFCADINQATAGRLSHYLAILTQRPTSEVHILLHSTGGGVADGIFIHNLFKTYPLPLTVYNGSSIQSIGTIAFLGAKRRVVSRHGLFMLHRTTFGPPAITGEILRELGGMAELEDARTKNILAENLTLEKRYWDDLRNNQFWFSSADAIKSGLATEIGDFAPPAGTVLWSFAV